MTMLAYLFVLTSLCNFANGEDKEINVCVKFVPDVQNGHKRRPTVPVENCQDRDAACSQIFNIANNAVYAQNLMP